MVLSKIKKRDGAIVPFDPERIKDAVHKAFLAVELGNGEKAQDITNEVVKIIASPKEAMPPTVINKPISRMQGISLTIEAPYPTAVVPAQKKHGFTRKRRVSRPASMASASH